MALFAGNLLPASFRGAPFAVLSDDIGGGRRVALHQYPGRDVPWAEDMGRAARTFHFRGFIVDGDVVFAGGPIQLQRTLLLAAFEAAGSGLLTHPTLGVLTVSVTRFAIGQDLGAGRMSSIEVEFVESGKRSFPSLLSQASGLLSAANLVKVGLAVDAVRAIAATSGRRHDLSGAAASWATQTIALGADATALHRLVAQLPGQFGRFAGGGNAGLNGTRAGALTATTSIADLVALASAARGAITVASVALGTSVANADLSDADDVATAAQALVDALVAACADPADAIRLLEQLLAFVPDRAEAATPIGVAFGRLLRRAATAALGIAAGQYQPTSSDDAAALIDRLGRLLDDVATDAADAGDDASFRALRTIRGAVVNDLRRRGSTLAQIHTFAPGAALPAVALAQRFYRDPSRAAQLVTQAMPVHPLFMPPSFPALAA